MTDRSRLLETEGFNQLARTRNGYCLYNRNDIGIGQVIEKYGEYDAIAMQFIARMCAPGDFVIEAGANIGAHTVEIARHVGAHGAVLAFEPQRLAFQALCANMALNSLANVHCYWAALGSAEGTINVPELDPASRNNFGALSIGDDRPAGQRVDCRVLDGLLSLPRLRLIKIDVAGMEEDVLNGGRQLIDKFKPVLYIENSRIEKSAALMRLIDSLGYDMHWHLPPAFNPDNFYGVKDNAGPATVSARMICVHRENPAAPVLPDRITDFTAHPLRHEPVGADERPQQAADRITGLFTSIKNIIGIDGRSQEVRDLLYGFFNNHGAALTPQELEAFYSRVIAELPRMGAYKTDLDWAYERLITLQAELARPDEVMRVFRRYLGDYAPVCDPVYDRMYQAGLLATGTLPVPFRRRERFFSLMQLFRQALPLQGLVAECGCFRGLSSFLLCSALKVADNKFSGKGYRIFDSFAGLSTPQPEDAIPDVDPDAARLRQMTQSGTFAASMDVVKKALGAFPDIAYFPGWIPHAFPDEADTRYRFVHVDVDIYQPTRDCLEYFYPRLVPGGIIVSDDYNWPGARRAMEEFCDRHDVTLQTTPYSQAYMIRRGHS